MRTEVLADAAALDEHREGWGALADSLGLAYCTPEWMLGWWRHSAPRGARLHVAVASDDAGLAGIAPCYTAREGGVRRLRFLASPISHRTQPLVRPGAEGEAPEALVQALAEAAPRPGLIEFDGLPAGSSWPALVKERWPAAMGAGLRRVSAQPAPALRLDAGGAEGWFAARSRNFRSQMRRARRDLAARGATSRIAASPDQVAQDVEAFIRLHHARWDWRGGSGAVDAGVEQMLRDEAHALVAAGRLRLAAVATEDATIAVQAIVVAGGEASYWLGGFDEEWTTMKPGIVALLTAVEDSFERGDSRFDFGAGDQDYKRRFTDDEETLAWTTVVPRGARQALDWVLLAPGRLRRAAGSATYDSRMALRRRRHAGGR